MERIFKSKDGMINADVIDNAELIKDAIANHDFVITYKDDDYGVLKSMMLQRDLSLDDYLKYYHHELTLSIPFMYSKTTSLIDEYNKESYKKIRELYNYLDDRYTLKFSDSCIYQVMSRIKIFLNKISTFGECFIKQYCAISNDHDNSSDSLKSIIKKPHMATVKCDDITLIAPIALISISIKENDDGTLSYYTSNAMTLYYYTNSKMAVFTDITNSLNGKFYNTFNKCSKINNMINYHSMNDETKEQEMKGKEENPFYIYNQNNLKVFINTKNIDNNFCFKHNIVFNNDNSLDKHRINSDHIDQKEIKPINSKKVILRRCNCQDNTSLNKENNFIVNGIILLY